MRPTAARAAADLRLLRAAVFAAACTALSAAGHVPASGHGLPPQTLGFGFATALLLTAPLAGRERSLPGIAAVLALGQAALHTVFACAQAARRTPPAGAAAPAEAAGHLDHALGAAGAGLTLPSGPMLLGHLLAALAAGWLLRCGEAALWRLVRLSAGTAEQLADLALLRALRAALRCTRALYRGLLPLRTAPRGGAAADGRGPVPPHALAPTGSVVRRGPPAVHRSALAA